MCIRVCAVRLKRWVELEACLLRGHLQGDYLPRPLAVKVSRVPGNDEGGEKKKCSISYGTRQDCVFIFLSKFQMKVIDVPVFCVSSPYLTAQPNPPKIHEGWWAYKEVVQGSFVPGRPPNSMQHFDAWNFQKKY